MKPRLALLCLVLAFAGCATPPANEEQAFQVSVLANQAWFVLNANRDQVPVVKASPSSPLEGPIWAEFNALLEQLVPKQERSSRQAEALMLIIPRVK